MKTWMKKIILSAMMCGCCLTLLLKWADFSGVQSLNGTVILTGNLLLSVIIFVMYFISVLFFEKHSKLFFCTGLVSLSMLFALMFAKFEVWGRFANRCAGPYVGLSTVLVTVVAYVFLFRNESDKEVLS